MAREARLDELLKDWQDLRRTGQEISAEELCQDCPELVTELKRRMEEKQEAMELALEPHATSLVPPIMLANRASPVTPLDISSDNTDENTPPNKSKPLALMADTEPVPGYRLTELL